MADPFAVLKAGYAKLFETGKYTDFTIICGPHTFKVHKSVICAQSDYFDAACSSFHEGESNTIKLKAIGEDGKGGDEEAFDDPEAVKLMIYFFYHFDYNAKSIEPVIEYGSSTPSSTKKASTGRKLSSRSRATSPPPPSPTPLVESADYSDPVMHARVFAAAVKYQVRALRKLAATKFASATKAHWNHPCFSEAVHIVYTTTAEDERDLRQTVSSTIHAHKELLDKPAIEAVLRSTQGLMYELLRLARGMSAVRDERRNTSGKMECNVCGGSMLDAFDCDRCGFVTGCSNGHCPHCE